MPSSWDQYFSQYSDWDDAHCFNVRIELEFEEEIKNAVKKVGSEFLKPIKDIVNNKITYGQIKLYLLISRLE